MSDKLSEERLKFIRDKWRTETREEERSMAGEVLALRARVRELEQENLRLKSDLKELNEAYNHLEASENC